MEAISGNWDGPVSADQTRNPFELLTAPLSRPAQTIWAVGGGKGGVGKSLLSSSLSISLARSFQKVVAIDCDFGAANLHTWLGAELPKQTLSDFTTNKVTRLDDCAVRTIVPNLFLISGAQDTVNAAEISFEDKVHLMNGIRQIDSDFVMVDLGAGTSVNTVDFFLQAHVQFLTVLPEPTSIENVYRFIKSLYYRRLQIAPELASVRGLIELATGAGAGSKNIRTPSDLYREISNANPQAALAMKAILESFHPKLVVNQVRNQADSDIGHSIKSVCKKYFGFDLDYVGFLEYDSSVWQSVRRKKPLMLEFPNSKLVMSIDRIVVQLLKEKMAL